MQMTEMEDLLGLLTLIHSCDVDRTELVNEQLVKLDPFVKTMWVNELLSEEHN